MDVSDTGVVIPALNAEKTIQDVISGLCTFGFAREHIIVIDDGSIDRTRDIAQQQRVQVIVHSHNMGKGAALKAGFLHARKSSLKAVITIDADGQHRIEDIGLFLNNAEDYDLILGTRADTTKMPWIRCMVNRTTSLVISLLSGVRIPDVQCGFRYCRLNIFERVRLHTSRYQTESELVYRVLGHGYRVGFVNISTIYNNERSYIRPVIDTLRFIYMSIGFLWH